MKNPFSSVAARKRFSIVLCRRVNDIFITHSGKQSNKLEGTLSKKCPSWIRGWELPYKYSFDFLFLSLNGNELEMVGSAVPTGTASPLHNCWLQKPMGFLSSAEKGCGLCFNVWLVIASRVRWSYPCLWAFGSEHRSGASWGHAGCHAAGSWSSWCPAPAEAPFKMFL